MLPAFIHRYGFCNYWDRLERTVITCYVQTSRIIIPRKRSLFALVSTRMTHTHAHTPHTHTQSGRSTMLYPHQIMNIPNYHCHIKDLNYIIKHRVSQMIIWHFVFRDIPCLNFNPEVECSATDFVIPTNSSIGATAPSGSEPPHSRGF